MIITTTKTFLNLPTSHPYWIPGRKSWMRLLGLSRRSTANVRANRKAFTRSASTRRRSSWRESTTRTSSVRKPPTCTPPHYSIQCIHIVGGEGKKHISIYQNSLHQVFGPSPLPRTGPSVWPWSTEESSPSMTSLRRGKRTASRRSQPQILRKWLCTSPEAFRYVVRYTFGQSWMCQI